MCAYASRLRSNSAVVDQGRHSDTEFVSTVIKDMLKHSYILLPTGEHGKVIMFTPSLTITMKQIERTFETLEKSFKACA